MGIYIIIYHNALISQPEKFFKMFFAFIVMFLLTFIFILIMCKLERKKIPTHPFTCILIILGGIILSVVYAFSGQVRGTEILSAFFFGIVAAQILSTKGFGKEISIANRIFDHFIKKRIYPQMEEELKGEMEKEGIV